MTNHHLDSRAAEYRAAYDDQVRGRGFAPGEPGAERVGPVLRRAVPGQGGVILYRDLGGLNGPELDAFIAAQRAHFAALGQPVEWKYHGHDRPADLPERLRAAGFTPEAPETVMIGEAAQVATAAAVPRLPQGVRLREVTARADFERIRELAEAVWGEEWDWLPDAMERWVSGAEDPCVVMIAESLAGEVICAGWVRFHTGTEFASLWGGSTLPNWRGQGLYRALVAARAALAARRGFRYVQVDALESSRPVLARVGLVAAAVTVPYVWRPADAH
ncbi:GNAT family N-acetyltransferase [Streptomyces albospinus]|uniref:GNAT family N-acetyltransferase n=1 Tax=Streptomyces albospinus TaxID=285515 RepID=UPI001670E36A|nr:GNAT family N-acetyltransferase [Streptomyces albospinus]